MSLAEDLLRQAESLVRREPRRPRQASLRRAISTAYYALFHLLIEDASRMLIRGRGAEPTRRLVSRAFVHSEMNRASRAFAGGTLPRLVDTAAGGVPMPKQLRHVAQAFVDLQQARHEADYDLTRSFSRADARALVDRTRQAFDYWKSVRSHEVARLYLLCLLLWSRWTRQG